MLLVLLKEKGVEDDFISPSASRYKKNGLNKMSKYKLVILEDCYTKKGRQNTVKDSRTSFTSAFSKSRL